MKKTVLVVFLFVFLRIHTSAQADGQNKKPLPGTTEAAPDSLLRKSDAHSTSIAPTSLRSDLLDVLFATNEDCILFINDEEREVVSKKAFSYLKLGPGTYRYSAKSQMTGDVYRDTFSVSSSKLNEVFIDMLYAIEVEKEKRASAYNQATTTVALQGRSSTLGLGQSATSAAGREKEQAAINAILSNMVPVKGGSFLMGNNRAPAADETEHMVSLNGFAFGKHEVTQEQWETIMGYNPSLYKGCASCPVENVSWEEVMRFIRKLNSITGKKFRLPTEAEWEYVAKLGGKADIERAGGVEEYIKQTAWGFANSGSKTHPVAQKPPTAGGVYDLFGNVSEWCMDWYGAFFYKEDYTDKNPEGPPLGKDKIIRGGNYKDYVGDRFRPSFRNKMNPKSKSSEVGFRLVLAE